jgi:hypothetical protein
MLRYCAEDQRGGWCCHGGGARDAGRAAKGRPWAVRHRRRVSACLLEGAVSNGTNSSVRGRSRTRTLELRIAGHREEGSSRRGQIALPRFDLWTVALFCFLPYTLWTLTFSRSHLSLRDRSPALDRSCEANEADEARAGVFGGSVCAP